MVTGELTGVERNCPACGGLELHATVNVEGADDSRPFDCTACGWLRWREDEIGCDRCRLHWCPEVPDRRGYSVSRAALLLGVSREGFEALLVDNPQLQRLERPAGVSLHRVPVHGLAAFLS